MLVLILIGNIGALCMPQTICASVKTNQIKKLIRKMDNYEYSVMEQSKSQKINLTKEQMAVAAALTIKVSEKNGVDKDEFFGDYCTYKLSNKKLQSVSRNMFGVKLYVNNLKVKKESDKLADAYCKSDGTPVIFWFNAEIDAVYEVHKIKIDKISSSKYEINKNVYYGHWGDNKGQSNYTIKYKVRKNSKSSYGYVITSMEIVALD